LISLLVLYLFNCFIFEEFIEESLFSSLESLAKMRAPCRLRAAMLGLAYTQVALAAVHIDGSPALVVDEELSGFDGPDTYYQALHDCPIPCADFANTHSWIGYTSVDRLNRCAEPMLLDFSVAQPLGNSDTDVFIRSCKLEAANATSIKSSIVNPKTSSNILRRDTESTPSCSAVGSQVPTDLKVLSSGKASGNSSEMTSLLRRMTPYFETKENCNEKFIFGYFNKTVAGVYIGAGLGKPTVASGLKALADQLQANSSAPSRMVAQLCDQKSADKVFGIAIDSTGDLAGLQKTVMTWASGSCVVEPELTSESRLAGVGVFDLAQSNSTLKTQPVKGNNSTVARRSISLPQKRADGSCTTYYVQQDETCDSISKKYGLKASDIDKFNAGKTWGWTDCPGMMARTVICISDGSPPMPASQAGTECGPLVPGSSLPSGGSASLADLNPCPLNACCSNWGFCGVSPLFCEKHPGKSNSPGSLDKNYDATCISNCGTGIKRSGPLAFGFGHVGYYESWNLDRPCLTQQVINANTDASYTHIHWAFGTIDPNTLQPTVNDTYGQWDKFKSMNSYKRIISFGGWAFSTEASTYDTLRKAMDPANAETFATNIAKFVNDNGLDGVDFDWEYPGVSIHLVLTPYTHPTLSNMPLHHGFSKFSY
jgi:hypothetical protein